jgi:acyl transferase domain-containing protein/NAD(P)H-dependent flavin oxidoreductase YrpB (nitropropane dioxygenase family)/NAD(P)-dependent dehydrogenase (short-subunit alcohol dehydrogenase family)/acyl carrier protein
MGNFDVLILTPAGTGDPSLAIAACRAGVRGFLDLEHHAESVDVGQALDQLARFTPGGFGVKLGSTGGALLPLLFADGCRCREVILAGGEQAEWNEWIALFRRRHIRVLVEAVTIAEAQRGAARDIDGLILKGHESGGRVGADTTFILLQRWQAAVRAGAVRALPVYAQGGIGLHTAAACAVAGAAGVVLDNQLLLCRESPLTEEARTLFASFDGSETQCLSDAKGRMYRCFARPGMVASFPGRAWERGENHRGSDNPWLIGQDAAFAKTLAERYRTVGGIVQALRQSVAQHIEIARRLTPLAEGSPLAQRHGTRYPIVQGPMTRVSDTAAFAESVAVNGALPFLALALLRRDDTEKLLRQTSERLAGRPWGAGILGFAPPEIRREQTEAIRAIRPPFALIAGGRPDQARELENEGIPTYLHVPSPGLLLLFLRDGARRFVFEGRECGGHVGPRSSFVLWETMCELLLEQLTNGGASAPRAEELSVLFAGGIHDALSAAMVAALAAPLAERGVAVGVLIGTAYLFTEEAVTANAIVPRYQQEAIRCQDTVLLETGPGHAIRCIATPYAETFEQEKRRLQSEGRKPDEIREALEALNVGRLRVASKGIDRPAPHPALPRQGKREFLSFSPLVGEGRGEGGRFIEVPEEEQFRRGMYMIGQAASLRQSVVPMKQLHEDISTNSISIVARASTEHAAPHSARERSGDRERPSDIAIIGMACFLPGANDVRTYWENILGRINAITEVPLDHWDWRLYYDPNPKARDKICSKWGGFLADVPFDPLLFGMPPNSLTSIEPVQLYALEAVRRALADAGYANRPFDRERTAVILGAGGGAAQLAIAYSFRSYLPMLATVPGLKDRAADILRQAEALLPEWTEDSFPGILVNVIAGRVANRFNFGGPNFAIDAACGSSLAALYAGVRELEMGTSDLAVILGADTVQNPYTYMAFSKTHAFSPRGRCSTFDEAADGIVISEGVVAVILKRLADAERDGDRIYAVIKGVGASSDGRDKGLTAPRPEGQLRALERAYAKANVSPARVEFVEAHGTGTVVGDQTEVASLGQIMRESGAAPRSCVIGSVKSMIGHTKCAAGLAGLVNATLALHHKVLPPLLVEKPNSKAKFEDSPFFLNTEARPWIHGGPEPRAAGVSAFGFGGTNFHAVLEEYTGDYLVQTQPALNRWPAELLVWRRSSTDNLMSAVQSLRDALARGAVPDLADLAYSLCKASPAQLEMPVLAIVATSREDLQQKLDSALTILRSGQENGHDPRGIYFAVCPPRQQGDEGRIAFLFPGQGSQYPNMLAQLAMVFPEVRQSFDDAEAALAGCLERPLGKFLFPPSAFTPEQEKQAKEALMRTDVAQPALGAASLGMFRLLTRLGVRAHLFAGHSYGDYVALCAAGALSADDLIRLSHERGRILLETTHRMPGAMAAIDADASTVADVLAGLDGVMAANLNSPKQTVLSGTEDSIRTALERFQRHGIRGQRIPVACAFHSPLVAAAEEPFARALGCYRFKSPQTPVYANTTAAPYPAEPAALVDLLRRHLASPVRFREEIEAMYAAGARVFVEVGPQGVLTALVGQTLAGKPHLAVASDLKGRPGLVQLQQLLAQLLVYGVPVQLERLYDGRNLRQLDWANLERDSAPAKLSPSTWLINSARVRPLHGPEPKLLGQAHPSTLEPAVETAPQSISDKTNFSHPPMMKPTPTQPSAPASSMNGTAHSNGVPHPPVPAAAVPSDEAAQVMLRFQELMSRFLDTQRSVMISYLQGGAPSASIANLAVPASPSSNGPDTNGHMAALPPPSAPAPPQPAPAVPQKDQPEAASTISRTPAPPPAELDRDAVTARLLDIVCKRTGYPEEMLGLDLDLEADLGIDSIKRVEILGLLAESSGGQTFHVAMEKLTNIKTLRGIIDCLTAAGTSGPQSSGSGCATVPLRSRPGERGDIQRMLVAAVDAPPLAANIPMLPGGTLLLTDDGTGVADALAQRLRGLGQQVALVSTMPGENVFQADLTSPQAVEELLAQIRSQCGPINGLIHLLPLAAPQDGRSWVERLQVEVKSLFLLARGLADELQKAAQTGNALLLAATGMGGSFGSGADAQLADDFSPGQGGVAGLIKSLAHEWPNVLVRVVDVDRRTPADQLAAIFLAELGDTDGPIEIGYQGEQRLTLQCRPSPLGDEHSQALLGNGKVKHLLLSHDSTVLLTGGARGITAAVALELARRYQPNLILIGRSPLPEDNEGSDTAGITGSAELKAALIDRLRREGRPASPVIVESAYQRLLHDREIRVNLSRLRQAGARVHYYQADVRDEAVLSAVLDDVYRRFGTLDGVIHGAGVIQDKLIRDKTPESYDRVFGTKVESALILSRHLKFEQLKFCVFFASVAGRFGNRGQADYAAANEVLSKLAVYLDRRWPGRVVSIAWGPWSSIGMVSELEKHLGQRGLQMIPPDVGPLFLDEELRLGRKGECEVVIAGDVGQLACPRRTARNEAPEIVC